MPTAARAIMIGASLCVPLTESGGPELNAGNVERWRVVAGRAVYFGHQSVGDDIAAGIDRLNKELSLGLRLVQTQEPSAVAHPAFVHFHAGRNQDPPSKNTAMLKVLESRPRADRAIIVLKYCYVDIDRNTDVQAVFAAYRAMVRQIRSRYPEVTIIHATVPVTTVENAMKAAAKELLGRSSVRQDAIARQQYNTLVRAAFAEREPLFDIARLESTRADGSQEVFASEGLRIETMATEYTRDGGHLNASGQTVVARGFLSVLAQVLEGGE